MRYLSLFSGIGGFEVAINKVFAGAECLGFCEIDPLLTKFYRKTFPHHKPLGDVRLVDFKPFVSQRVDLVVAGFPCTDVSMFNIDRNNLQGAKSSLFSEVVRCLRECKPKYFLIENVTRTSTEVQAALNSAFGVRGVAINSNSVSAQNRNRMFWFNWTLPDVPSSNPRITFDSILMPKHQVRDLQLNEHAAARFVLETTSLRRIRHISDKTKSATLCGKPTHVMLDKRFEPHMRRKLHRREMERMQTFPDGYSDSLSYTKALFGLKNAVTVNVAAMILRSLKSRLTNTKRSQDLKPFNTKKIRLL
jgi:site-specific DNA-cytosine methylase